LVPGRAAEQTPDQYLTEILQDLIENRNETGTARISLQSSRGGLGDETAGLVAQLIGPNALHDSETRNLLAILRAAFEKPQSIAPSAKDPSRTLQLLNRLAASADQESLRNQISETIAYIQSR
jgi:hypothetical protein